MFRSVSFLLQDLAVYCVYSDVSLFHAGFDSEGLAGDDEWEGIQESHPFL